MGGGQNFTQNADLFTHPSVNKAVKDQKNYIKVCSNGLPHLSRAMSKERATPRSYCPQLRSVFVLCTLCNVICILQCNSVIPTPRFL